MEAKLIQRMKTGCPGPGPAGDADPSVGKNGTKKSKTPSPFEGEGEDKKGVETNSMPHHHRARQIWKPNLFNA